VDTFWRLCKQFWLPFLVALGWTINALGGDIEKWTLSHALANFATSFFLASWATGQFFRVKNQSQVERNLFTIEERVTRLLENLSAASKDLIAHITGGESACYVYIMPMEGPGMAQMMVIHQGAHPIYDIAMRVSDLDVMEPLFKRGGELTMTAIQQADQLFKLDTLIPGFATTLGPVLRLSQKHRHRFNIFITARNGAYTELYRAYRGATDWQVAVRLQAHGKIVHEQINPNTFIEELRNDADWKASDQVERITKG
jgi:hypothetical protein